MSDYTQTKQRGIQEERARVNRLADRIRQDSDKPYYRDDRAIIVSHWGVRVEGTNIYYPTLVEALEHAQPLVFENAS